MNGLFWKDFLGHPGANPVRFALDYYSRYPAINPTSYPPVFYLLEAAAFAALGPSPWVAKGLVLLFALMAGGYTTAWLRRSIVAEAGYFGPVVLMLPAVVWLSHSIMLNVPALALTAAALYHARCWLDEPASRQIYLAAGFGVLAILCYLPSAILLFVVLAWIPALGRSRVLAHRRTLAVAAICGLCLVPWLLITLRWSPGHVEMTTPASRTITRLDSWSYYPRHLGSTFGWGVVIAAALGAVAALAGRRWRREAAALLIWIATTYLLLTYLKAKESRYLLALAIPLVCLGVIPLLLVAGRTSRSARRLVPGLAITLLSLMGAQAWCRPLPSVRNFAEIVAFLDGVAPDEPLFYDGEHNGVFTFYVRTAAAARRRRVVRGDKLLYVVPLNRSIKPREFVTSRRDVVESLRTRSGCHWLAIEQGSPTDLPSAARLLREAVRGPEFRLVRSVSIREGTGERVDIYRVLVTVEPDPPMIIPLPMAGEGFQHEVQPGTGPAHRPGKRERRDARNGHLVRPERRRAHRDVQSGQPRPGRRPGGCRRRAVELRGGPRRGGGRRGLRRP
jgi:hypothetical protein